MAYLIIPKKTQWSLIHREYAGHKVVKTRTVKLGTPEADALGVFQGLTIEQAKAALKLNRLDGKARYHAERRARLSAARAERDLRTSAWLPPALVAEFEMTVLKKLSRSRDRWLIVKSLIADIDVPPYDWHWRSEVFWKRFQLKGWSIGYVRKLLHFLNKWGEFYCRRTGKSWTKVERPMGEDLVGIKRRHYEVHRPTTYALTPEHITKVTPYLKPGELNSLKLAFWCALRYEELRFVLAHKTSRDTWYVDKDERGFAVFHIFQEKLMRRGIAPEFCWKAVPLVEPEQLTLQWENLLPVPLKTVREVTGVNLTNRSARKGFSILMELRGYSDKCIADWLGHIGDDTRRLNYRTRRIAIWEPANKYR